MKSKLAPIFASLFDVQLSAQSHVQSLLHQACTDAAWIRGLTESENSRGYTQSAIANALNAVPFKDIRVRAEEGDCRVNLQVKVQRNYRVSQYTIYIHIPLSALAGHVAFGAWRRKEAKRLQAVSTEHMVRAELTARAHARRMKWVRKEVAAAIRAEADKAEAAKKKGAVQS